MLSVKQQKFMLMLLEKKMLTKRNNGLYSSKAFYKMIASLRRKGLVYSKKGNDGTANQYSLTVKGSIMARILASFDDAPPPVRERYALW